MPKKKTPRNDFAVESYGSSANLSTNNIVTSEVKSISNDKNILTDNRRSPIVNFYSNH